MLAMSLVLSAGACGESDRRAGILSERARWKVVPLNWSLSDESRIQLSTRISGPTRSDLQQLTFRVMLVDAQENVLKEMWRTVDLTEIPMGGPQDKLFVFDATEIATAEVDLQLSMVLDPTPEEARHIAELRLDGAGSG